MEHSPLPDLSLIRMRRYSTMTVQYSRGCPFNCEFCDIIEIYGRRPRTKAVAQVLAELDQLRDAGWRDAVFIVDDNFIGNKARAKALLHGHGRVGQGARTSRSASSPKPRINLADDLELLQLMQGRRLRFRLSGHRDPGRVEPGRQPTSSEHPPQPARQRRRPSSNTASK